MVPSVRCIHGRSFGEPCAECGGVSTDILRQRAPEPAVYLAFTNPNVVKAEERAFLACKVCSNKTYVLLHFDNEFPVLQCAACGQHMGKMGWAE